MVEPLATACTGEPERFRPVGPVPASAVATSAAELLPLWLYGALAVKPLPTDTVTVPESQTVEPSVPPVRVAPDGVAVNEGPAKFTLSNVYDVDTG